jgi:hypothetical protein
VAQIRDTPDRRESPYSVHMGGDPGSVPKHEPRLEGEIFDVHRNEDDIGRTCVIRPEAS